ncbi:LuxR C-terminal-related transcriptional regulator [Gordonia sp. HY002]|uniref:helix-turn-helix transcriptional regulator n=1 Tax=Gordonia zhenghanii TaxID=2911516 RepID=UPI001EF00207|nr:LuxR C-terminal-related transcriptional regulator [Gordonia zhenghanii]MCF8569721.1 LuxR C-terminal-related transcriptional regulator [Gordonia zhenghanii]MCF8603245.1 LuxR C-terminal-related transcriptional regulator [Gordonia zhenghanii]
MTVAAIHTAPGYQTATRTAVRQPTAEARRREALARLSSRVMPLPGRPVYVEAPLRRRGRLAPVAAESDPIGSIAPELPRPTLTDREVEVLRTWLMVDSKPACGEELHISLGTVNTHLTRIRAKYSDIGRPASTKAALVARAIQDDIIDIEEL